MNAKREAILEAALVRFAARGFYGTSIPDILELAGASSTTMYGQFNSKAELANAVYRLAKTRFTKAIFDHFPQNLPFREQWQELWRRHHTFAAEQPHIMAFLQLHYHPPYLDQTSNAMSAQITSRLMTFVKNGQEQGFIKNGPAYLIMSIFLGAFLNLWTLTREQGRAPTTEELEFQEQCIWEAIRA